MNDIYLTVKVENSTFTKEDRQFLDMIFSKVHQDTPIVSYKDPESDNIFYVRFYR